MITWYKPSERTPEVGDNVVCLTQSPLVGEFILTIGIVYEHWFDMSRWEEGELWTYASNLNLLKE